MSLTADERYMLKKELEKKVAFHDRKAFETRQELKELKKDEIPNRKREWAL